jgi:hypothetical protein
MSFDRFEVLLKVITVLDELHIPYLIGGSFASSLYGWARSTHDADLVAVVKVEHARALTEKLESAFHVDEQAIRRAVQARRHFSVIHIETAFKVDVFISKSGGFAEQQLERRQLRTISKDAVHQAYFASPEDTVLAKLEWYRRGNEVSDIQWRDVREIIKVQGEQLDLDYMRHWAQELNVADLLEQALIEAKRKMLMSDT